jgi:acyl-CoA reductase-like NAD-dependent aldehyde dehydrogenase
MPLPPHLAQQYDEYAAKAEAEFTDNWQKWTARDVAVWWWKWCQIGRTHHDRLGRILVRVTGVRPQMGVPTSDDEDKELGFD